MRVFISARFFSFFLLLLRRVSARVRLFSLHTLSFRISRKKESRVRKRGTRGPRISETELRLFGGTPTFLLGLFSRLPRICIQISLIVALNQDLGWLRAFVPAYFFSADRASFFCTQGKAQDCKAIPKHFSRPHLKKSFLTERLNILKMLVL